MSFNETEICSFEPVEKEFTFESRIRTLNPFYISFSRRKLRIKIKALSNVEFIQLPGHEDEIVKLSKNEVFQFHVSTNIDSFKAGFRIQGGDQEFYWNVWTL